MPTPCQKCFTIAFVPCAVDCGGDSSTVAGLAWVIVETDDPVDPAFGDIELAATGASGTYSLIGAGTNASGSEGVCSGSLTTRFCNTTNDEITLTLTFTFTWTIEITASLGVGGQSGFSFLKDAVIFYQQTVTMSPFSSGTNTLSGTDTVTSSLVTCPACSVTEFEIVMTAGYNCGGPFSDPANASFSIVGTLDVTI